MHDLIYISVMQKGPSPSSSIIQEKGFCDKRIDAIL